MNPSDDLRDIVREPKREPVPITILFRPLITVEQRRLILEALGDQQYRLRGIIDRVPLEEPDRDRLRNEISSLRQIVHILGDAPIWRSKNANNDAWPEVEL